MSEVQQLLQRLCQQGIRLWPQEGKLRYRGAEHLITPELLAQLKTHKAALLQALCEPTYGPLSYGQKGLWLIQQSVPESFVYNVSFALRLYFPIDATRWQEAAQLLVNRHAALRTTFPVIDSVPTQKVDGYQPVDFAVVDATTWSDATLIQTVQAAHEQPFAVTTGPLFRMRIFSHGPADHVLFVSAHHIAIDGWSIHLLIEELLQLYVAVVQGAPTPLPLVATTYLDYVTWQADLLQREGETLWAYWKEQLAGKLPLLQLPADHPRPAVQSYRGVSQAFQLSPALTAQLKQVARQQNCTLYVLLLAAYEVLLHRYSGQDDIVIGLTMAGRHHPEFARVIGYFTSPVVARADFSGKPAFPQLVGQVRQQVFAALEHQDYPFSLLVEKLNPKRDPSRPPVFQANFVLQNFHHTQFQNAELAAETGLRVETIPLALAEGQLDLSLEMVDGPAGLEGYLKGNADLLTQTTVARMAAHWQILLQGIVANPVQPIAQLPLLTVAERRQILVDWNQTAAPYPKDKCIHHFFEEQVAKTPDRIAVVSEAPSVGADGARPTLSFTYGQLNALANQLATHLQSLGVGVETLVGLFVERSAVMVVGILGILKAGAAYVPLDLDAPAERLALMLEDTQSPVVVTLRHLLDRLPPPTAGQRFVCLDELLPLAGDSAGPLASSIQPFASPVAASHLAYILYTSGSTGRPKGVAVEHRQVAAYVYSVIQRCGFEPGMRYAMVQPLTVDSCITVLYPPLWTGGTLHVIDRNHALDPEALAATFQRYEIDCLKIAPSHLAALRAAATEPRQLLPRKRLVIGGEASKWAWMQELAAAGSCQVYNHYGPTETTVGVTTYRVYPERTASLTNTPIGYPLANTQAYILNGALEPAPVGVVGELYIGGDFVARGYLHRPDITAERFIRDPFAPPSSDPTQQPRLYRTGDWARYLPDGAIEYLGRMDDQVKIHGFRIELGEVEAQIKQHPAVETCLVIAHTDQTGEKRLVAYVVPNPETGEQRTEDRGQKTEDRGAVQSSRFSLQSSDVRDYLKLKLPSHMIPAAFVMLDALPLSAHGKVDRQALPAPDESQSGPLSTFVAPQTATEQTLAAIWAQVLRLPQVGRDDNFFEIGGDSISSLQVVSRAQAAGIQLTYRQIFEAQTIAALAQTIPTAATTAATPPTTALVTGPVPLTPIQRRFFAQPHGNLHHVNQSVLLTIDKGIQPAGLATALTYLVQYHDALRLRFTPITVGNQTMWSQHYAEMSDALMAQVTASVHALDLSALTPAEQQARLHETNRTLQASLHLTDGPVFQVAHVRYGADQPDQLLFIIHHLMIDWVSWPVLIADLWTVYGQRVTQTPIHLPPKSSSFQAWANWLQSYAQGGEVLAEVGYWLKLGAQSVAPLPIDYPANIGQDTLATVQTVTCRLSAEETRLLLQAAPVVYQTHINDLLLAALAQSVIAWQRSQQPPAGPVSSTLLLEMEHHGREALAATLDLSRTVGWFTAIYPVALRVECNEPGALIKSIKAQLRQVPHNGLGYGVLRYLNPETAALLAPLPKAEIAFNYGGRFAEGQATTLGGDHDAHEPLGYRLRIDGGIIDDQLHFGWRYSQTLYRNETVAALAEDFIVTLQRLLTHCLTAEAGGYTPDDFPDLALDQAGLDRVVAQIHEQIAPNPTSADKSAIEAIYPLSPSQQGLLFDTLAQQTATQNGAGAAGQGAAGKYVEIYTYDLPGALDVAAFQRAWQVIVARHAALRTGFLWTGLPEPLQFVLAQVAVPMRYEDWQTLSPDQQQAQWRAHLQQLTATGFDMSCPPLMHLALLRLADDRHRFVWAAHHILKDGWGTQLILRELMALYAAQQEPANLAQTAPLHAVLPPAPSYQHYIRWLQQQDGAQPARFWCERLRGFTRATRVGVPKELTENELADMLYEFPEETRFCDLYHALSPATTLTLQKLARAKRLTLNSLMQGTWALLLSRYSGETDVLFGATVSGRPAAVSAVEAMVGLFINTIPVRVIVDPDQPLWDWMQRLQAQALEQDAYAFCSAGQIHRWSEIPGAQPLFESILVFQNYPVATGGAPGEQSAQAARSHHLTLDYVPTPGYGARTQYVLTIQIFTAERLLIGVVYDQWRLSQAAVTQIVEHWTTLLESIAEQPDQTISQLCNRIPTAQIPTLNILPQTHTRAAYLPPRTAHEQQLVQIWETLLGIRPIGIRDHFFALGGHSLLAVHLLTSLQEQAQQPLPLNLLLQYPTVEALAAYLAQRSNVDQNQEQNAALWAPLVALQPHGSQPPFFCLPGIEGIPTYLYPLAQALGPDQPFYSLQAVGLDGVTAPPASIEAEAAYYLAEIRRVQPHGPYYVGGHSRGGRVAYALAQQLRKEGEDVNLLAILDAAGPGVSPADAVLRDETALLVSFVVHLTQAQATRQQPCTPASGSTRTSIQPDLHGLYALIDALSPEERLVWLQAELERLQLLPTGGDPRWARGMFTVYKNNLWTDAQYRPTAPLPVTITLLAAQERYAVPPGTHDELAAGWSPFGNVAVMAVPGNHFTMLSAANAGQVADQITRAIAQGAHNPV